MNQEQHAFHNLINIACKKGLFADVQTLFEQAKDFSVGHETFEMVANKFSNQHDFKNDSKSSVRQK